MASRDAPADARPARAPLAWLRRVERGMRPLDHLSRGVALGVGAAVGAGAGLALGWSGERWTLAAGAALLGGAAWLVRSAEPVAVVERGVPSKEPERSRPSGALGMIDLPGGRFWMGSAEGDAGSYGDERPRHEVEVEPFAIGKYVVTQKLYREVMNSDPGSPGGDDLPINNVSWFDAVRFCNALSAKAGLRTAYRLRGGEAPAVEWDRRADGFRLPTEAEWEYAARAGTTTAYSFGDRHMVEDVATAPDYASGQPTYVGAFDRDLLSEHAWWSKNAAGEPHPVGTKKPNPWGLFDVHGNVYEWCWDTYGAYGKRRPSRGDRVLRGGSFSVSFPWALRSAVRIGYPPRAQYAIAGFRLVRSASREPS